MYVKQCKRSIGSSDQAARSVYLTGIVIPKGCMVAEKGLLCTKTREAYLDEDRAS